MLRSAEAAGQPGRGDHESGQCEAAGQEGLGYPDREVQRIAALIEHLQHRDDVVAGVRDQQDDDDRDQRGDRHQHPARRCAGVVDEGFDPDVLVAPGEYVTLDMDGAKGDLLQASGHLTVDLFGFFQLDGDFAIEKSTETVTLADADPTDATPAEVVTVDMLTIGANDVSAFAGVGGGTAGAIGLDLDEVFNFINPVALFRGQWQFKKGALSEAEYEAMLEDKVYPVFERVKAHAKAQKLLDPKVVYGYFPCNSEKNDLIVFDPESGNEKVRFTFPRQPRDKRRCIADYFLPLEGGKRDFLAVHLVTMGAVASQTSQQLFQASTVCKLTGYCQRK